jgi:hypothetical protein
MAGIANGLSSATHVIRGDFARLKAVIESIPTEITILGRKIRSELLVVADDAFHVLPDIPDMLEATGNTAFGAVKRIGAMAAADFTALEAGSKKRLDNEGAVLDLFYVVVIGSIITVIVSIFMMTQSIKIIILLIVIFIISLLIYAICDLVMDSA